VVSIVKPILLLLLGASMSGFLNTWMRRLPTVGLIVGLAMLAGCGAKANSQTGVVEGKVTIGGIDANSGNVIFTVNGTSITGIIDGDGNYRAIGVPAGNAQITVTSVPGPALTSSSGPGGLGGGPATKMPPTDIKDMPGMGTGVPRGKQVPIPARYSKPETSGLTYTVKNGTQTHDIQLTK
jgi:hypothetical protein